MPSGNSRARISWNSGEFSSCPILRQWVGWAEPFSVAEPFLMVWFICEGWVICGGTMVFGGSLIGGTPSNAAEG